MIDDDDDDDDDDDGGGGGGGGGDEEEEEEEEEHFSLALWFKHAEWSQPHWVANHYLYYNYDYCIQYVLYRYV